MLKLTSTQQALLGLIGQGVFNKKVDIPVTEWDTVERMANEQGVLSMLYAGAIKNKKTIPSRYLQEWRGIFYSDHTRNERLIKAQNDVLALIRAQGIRVVVLKGTSISIYYKHPEIRCLGDVDLLVDKCNMQRVGDILTSQGYTEIHVGHSFHNTYEKTGITIEVHHAVTEFPKSEGGRRAESIMNKFLDDAKVVSMNEMEFPALSETHQALMLLLHMERHMTEMNIGLRQLCDWAVFVSGDSVDHWKQETLQVLDYCGMLVFAKVASKACVIYLGVQEEHCSWCMDAKMELVDAFMDDILQGGNFGAANAKKIGSLFTDRSILGQKQQGIVKGIFAKIKSRACFLFPLAKKHKVLLPICCIYVPFEYLFRSLIRKPNRRGIAEMLDVSRRRRKLIQNLCLYDVVEKE